MKKKGFLWSIMTIAMVTLLNVGLASCGKDLEDLEFGDLPPEDITDDDGVPSGTPGNESMFGYYSSLGTNSETWQSFKSTAESNVSLHQGDYISWSRYYDGDAIWIVDGKTMYWVSDYINFSTARPVSSDEAILLEYETYKVTYSKVVVGRWQQYTDTYYLAHYMFKVRNTDKWEGRYAMNGSKMVVHTDEFSREVDGQKVVAVDYVTHTWDYSNGTIDADGVKYTKIN